MLLLGLDGLRSDAMNENNSPFMFALSATDEVYFTASHSVESITYSGPNWSSILTGVHYAKHRVTSNNFEHPNLIFKNQYTSSQADLAPTITLAEPFNADDHIFFFFFFVISELQTSGAKENF